ncbi:DUF4097 domain-containing protein [Streptomyces sp. NPDC059740]|uniref:DUF4097 family beta strand repeat-containing protein n=1 Tax=Streptomyces sp. NPDC059740 TaxID=3346926 RepID=UPI00365F4203
MSARTEWPVAGPRTLEFEEPVDALTVRIVGGAVNVVGARGSGPARVEVTEVHGPPLTVAYQDGALSIGYEDLPGKGLWEFLDPSGRRRRAVVSVTLPADAGADVGVVEAATVVSGLGGPVSFRTVTGEGTLVGLAGAVRAQSVAGAVSAQHVTGELRLQSVSGDLTAMECGGPRVRAETVSGDIVVDLDEAAAASDIGLTTVSGQVAVRLPDPSDAQVEASTTSGTVSNAFEDLRVSGAWGTKRVTGRLGSGTGRLRLTTVSGGLALLRRPPSDESSRAAAPDGTGAETTPPARKKVL